MGRKRKTNKHLPKRVYKHGNNYRLHLPGKPPRVIGRVDDYPAMLIKHAEIMGGLHTCERMSDVFNRYLAYR
ncbi:MAG: hypothetical protein AAFV59_16780, partial [Pseudomonadota bacterium]